MHPLISSIRNISLHFINSQRDTVLLDDHLENSEISVDAKGIYIYTFTISERKRDREKERESCVNNDTRK